MNDEDDLYNEGEYGVFGDSYKRKPLKDIDSREAEASAFLLGDMFDRVSHAFELMNWFASGQSQESFSRVLPTDILGEVYFILAPVYEHMKMLNDPKATKAAKNWYARRAEEIEQKAKDRAEIAEAEAQYRAEKAEKLAGQRIQEVKDECKVEIYRVKSEMDARVAKAVAKAILKTENRLKGTPRVVSSSGRRVRV